MKSTVLFLTLLFFIALARVFWGGVLMGSTDDFINLTRLKVRPPADFVSFPEDVLPFSADEWQQRFGCAELSPRYIGYTAKSQLSLAVIEDGKNERLYESGDALPGDTGGRIIFLDEHRIVLRDKQGVRVMCRDGATTPAPPGEGHSVVLPARGDVYSGPLGEVAQVVNDEGTVTGYRLNKCQRYCGILKSLSLQTGDVITAVQGYPVAGLTFTQIKDRMMKQQQDIQLTIERGGQSQLITLPWRNIQPLTRFIPETSPDE